MKIYLIRHGEGIHNATGNYGFFDPPLTLRGTAQARSLQGKFPDVDLVLCSTSFRAIQTANLAFPYYRICATDLLLEHNTGTPCNQRQDIERQSEMFDHIDFQTFLVEPIEKESDFKAVNGRARQVVELLSGLKHDTVAIVSHQGFGKSLMLALGAESLSLGNCGHIVINFTPKAEKDEDDEDVDEEYRDDQHDTIFPHIS